MKKGEISYKAVKNIVSFLEGYTDERNTWAIEAARDAMEESVIDAKRIMLNVLETRSVGAFMDLMGEMSVELLAVAMDNPMNREMLKVCAIEEGAIWWEIPAGIVPKEWFYALSHEFSDARIKAGIKAVAEQGLAPIPTLTP